MVVKISLALKMIMIKPPITRRFSYTHLKEMRRMYRETLIEQKKLLEEKQRSCERIDLSDLIELGKNIIILAKKIDEYDAEEKTE